MASFHRVTLPYSAFCVQSYASQSRDRDALLVIVLAGENGVDTLDCASTDMAKTASLVKVVS